MRWTRRRFVGSGAVASAAMTGLLRGQEKLPAPQSQGNSPEIAATKWVPLLEEAVARPLRYQPAESGGFAIQNGVECFNRPLYGANIPFRADGGDRPEFSLYLPGHGGNLRLGLVRGAEAKWLHGCDAVRAEYLAGRLDYVVEDALLGPGGVLRVSALTVGAGLWTQIAGDQVLPGLELVWAFGGVSGRKGKRNGDIGCEDEPISRFFQVRPEEFMGNVWTLGGSSDEARAEVSGAKLRLRVSGPAGAALRVVDGGFWDSGLAMLLDSRGTDKPVLVGRVGLGKDAVLLRVDQLVPAAGEARGGQAGLLAGRAAAEQFGRRRDELARVAGALLWKTPDRYLDGMAGALCTGADAIWDEALGCVMHGAVAWRMPLAGWRGPYALDVTGRHDRMKRHVRRWIARQNVTEVTNGSGGQAGPDGFRGIVAARGMPDAGSMGARSEGLLHSNGDLSKNHYDMNLVFFDALLRHLRWTGDVEFARECWPALGRHAAWERRLFRREYGPAGGATMPLYEAYAAIWASDNLQYSGGGTAHGSAYNYYLNARMAELAALLEEPGWESYREEAAAILRAMRGLLWMPERGAYAESREWLGERRLLENPAVWTVYQVLDSECATDGEAWRMCADRLRALRKVPVRGRGVPADAGWQIGCSDWQPYVWSLTLLTLGENLGLALGLFQAGMAEEGYGLLRGALLDAGYRGLCPGNFPMSLQLDPHRQESQRDFGDPIGCAARVVVEGLWGVRPNLLVGSLELRPQLPLEWEGAELEHPELTVRYSRVGMRERWEVRSLFARPLALRLTLRGRTVEAPVVQLDGQVTGAVSALRGAVGEPRIAVECGRGQRWVVEVEWHGEAPVRLTGGVHGVVGEVLKRPMDYESWDVPAGFLDGAGRALRAGSFTALLRPKRGDYLAPLEVTISAPAVASVAGPERFETVTLGGLLTGRMSEILTRGYYAPRSGMCSLALPGGLLGGWANFDVRSSVVDLRGEVRLPDGLVFDVPERGANCRFVSHWEGDEAKVRVALEGRARAVYLLLVGTTFPQATGTVHAEVRVSYAGGGEDVRELRSPGAWWPVEQDYPVDDYLFRLGSLPEGVTVPWRVDLKSGTGRRVSGKELRGRAGAIAGGAGFVVRVGVAEGRELAGAEVRCCLSGVVLGLVGVAVGR